MFHYENEDVYWIAFNTLNTIPPHVILSGYRQLGSLEKLWFSNEKELEALNYRSTIIDLFLKSRKKVNIEHIIKQIEILEKKNVQIIRFTDELYPKSLKKIDSVVNPAPLLLYQKGVLLDFTKNVAIIGTRQASLNAHLKARSIAKQIADSGYTIVSGLARGTDTEAHCGALDTAEGKTIAVLSWFDPIYPPENSELAKDIERRGTIIGETYFRPSRGKYGYYNRGRFVKRNRIISGISKCLIAVETGLSGGTIHQVNFAFDQGLKVFVVKPGSNKMAIDGFQKLRNMGAIPIDSAETVLKYLQEDKIDSVTNLSSYLK